MKQLPLWISTLVAFAPLAAQAETEPTEVDSTITAVTVFLDRAEVTRSAELEVPAGAASLRFDELPAMLQANTLRLDGAGNFTLLDIKYDSRIVRDEPDPRVADLKTKEKDLLRDIKKHEDAAKRLEGERGFVADVAKRYTAVPKEQSDSPEMDIAQWRDLLAFQQMEFERIDEQLDDLRYQADELRRELQIVQEKIRKLGANRERHVFFADVQIEANAATELVLDLSYVVRNASWQPSYNLSVNSDANELEMTYFGEIQQQTGEAWDNVALKLSTAKPMVGGKQPELNDWYIDFLQMVPRAVYFGKGLAAPMPATTAAPAPQMFNRFDVEDSADFAYIPEMQVAVATVETGASASVFAIEKPGTVAADSTRSRVVIMKQSFPAVMRYSAVPKLTPYAYLKARVKNSTDYPLLPGRANVFLDNSFVAESQMELVAPEEAFWVFLGIDEGISVERRLVTDLEDNTGFTRNGIRKTYKYQFEIENNKTKPIELVLWDQIPKSRNDDIKVDLKEPNIARSKEQIKINDRDFIEWIFQMAPGEKLEPVLEYNVEYPKDKEVTGLP